MWVVRSPLGAIGVVLVALEAVLGASLFALEGDRSLQLLLVAVMSMVLVSVTSVVLWLVVYLAIKKPGFLFNPSEVASLSEDVQQRLYAMPENRISLGSVEVTLDNVARNIESARNEPDAEDGVESD